MKEPIAISRTKVYSKLQQTHGRFFTALFTKSNGEVRNIVAQLRPQKKDAKKASPAKESNSYILVGDVSKYRENRALGLPKDKAYDKSYRMINIATIMQFRAEGQVYLVQDP